MENDEKMVELYLKQVKLLNTFLSTHAISKVQYEKSFGDLTAKMGMEKYAEAAKKIK